MKSTLNLRLVTATLIILSSTLACSGQMEKRKSPLDSVAANLEGTQVSITYSRPSKRGREIFGGLVPYGKVWRTGANEATVLETDGALRLPNDEVLEAGRYALFTIPGPDKWVVIINGVPSQWGAYNYDAEQDVSRFEVEAGQTKKLSKKMTFQINEAGVISLNWDQTQVQFKVSPQS